MVSETPPTGSVASALAHAARLLERNPSLAEAQSREILNVSPGHPEAMRLLAKALLAQGNAAGAISTWESLIRHNPDSSRTLFELALAYADAGRSHDAIAMLRRLLRLVPQHPHAWRVLGDHLTLIGDVAGANAAYARHVQASVRSPQLLEAAAALCAGHLAVAERLLRQFLSASPTDIAAIRMLGEIGTRLGRLEDAERLLRRCLELAPDFREARHNYAIVLHRQNRPLEALSELDILLQDDARNANYRALKLAALGRIGEYEQAITGYESLLRDFPAQPKAWMSYGHALKTVGRSDKAIDAYRQSISLLPSLGEAYWSLANLKTFRFAPEDRKAMEAQLARPDLEEEDRVHFHFALGKALEDENCFAGSFAEYERGNRLRKNALRYRREDITQLVQRSIALFTAEFFAARVNFGIGAPDPIFIIGLTRSGSTLIEQILSSHSAVEGTMELPDILTLTRRFGGRRERNDADLYPAGLERLTARESAELGEEYLARTRVHRKRGTPFFIDKLPNNWTNIGFIHLALPNARIIDARRHPLACCFSNYKQLFARGQGFSYDLTDCGIYYRDYLRLLANFDRVLPGRIHRVFHEALVVNPETEVRRLLEHCGLSFEPRCLRFYENARAVRTASSEQVRQPLYRDGLEHWRNFEPWLDPLKAALGPALEAYPERQRDM